MMGQSRFHVEVSHYNYVLGEHKKDNTTVKLASYQLTQVSLSTNTYAFDLTNASSVTEVTRSLRLFSFNTRFSASLAQKDSFPQREVFMFPPATTFSLTQGFFNLGSNRIFSSQRFYFFYRHAHSPIVRASDMIQVSIYVFCKQGPNYDKSACL